MALDLRSTGRVGSTPAAVLRGTGSGDSGQVAHTWRAQRLWCYDATALKKFHWCDLILTFNGDYYNCPRVLSGFGRRSFSVSGPDAWNSLPRQLRGIDVASTFKRHLKSELFFQAYGVSTTASTVAEP